MIGTKLYTWLALFRNSQCTFNYIIHHLTLYLFIFLTEKKELSCILSMYASSRASTHPQISNIIITEASKGGNSGNFCMLLVRQWFDLHTRNFILEVIYALREDGKMEHITYTD